MKKLLISATLLSFCIFLAFIAFHIDHSSLQKVFVLLSIAALWFSIIITGDGVSYLIGGLVFGFGAIWSIAEMVSTINFDAPFLTSFYWSTFGFGCLGLFLLIATVMCLIMVTRCGD